jgi:pyruvate dehydrogenase E1 component alpha subunit
VYTKVHEAASRARNGEGPTLIESVTYRYKGHSRSDKQAYRTREEVNEWKDERDPILRFEALLVEGGLISEEEVKAYRDNGVKAIDEALDFSENSPDPDVATLLEGVYAD